MKPYPKPLLQKNLVMKCFKSFINDCFQAVIAAKGVEVATESSLGPIFQMFALIPTCGLLQEMKNFKQIGFSDLRKATITMLCKYLQKP